MTYEVVIERDPEGDWIARVPSVRGCHSYGRSIAQARRRIREALSLWVENADEASLTFDVRLPTTLRRELHRVDAARGKSASAARLAQEVTRAAARDLTEVAGLSRRDTAELLGLSHQRIQQLLDAGS